MLTSHKNHSLLGYETAGLKQRKNCPRQRNGNKNDKRVVKGSTATALYINNFFEF
jgi:hypothetical protein